MSEAQPFTSDTQNWYGTATTALSGQGVASLSGSVILNFSFTINADNSITGSGTGSGALDFSAQYGQGNALPETTAKIGGNYDPATGNVNLTLQLASVNSPVNVTSQSGSATAEEQLTAPGAENQPNPVDMQLTAPGWSDILNGLTQTDTLTVTPQAGTPYSQTNPTGLMDSVPWNAPPVLKVDGGTAQKTTNFTGAQGMTMTLTTTLVIHPSITIQRTDSDDNDDTFITTDTPAFTVTVNQPGYDTSTATWQVTAVSSNAGPPDPATGTGATFEFDPASPSNNPTTGANVANQALIYNIQVTVGNLTATSVLDQDEIDVMRQEYVDYNANWPFPGFDPDVPARASFAIAGAPFNGGNYGHILDGGLQQHLNTVTQNFNQVAQGNINVTSAYRNPQRNMWIYGGHPRPGYNILGSYHVWGRALDMVVNPANGNSWTSLCNAGAPGNHLSQCEDAPGHAAPGGCTQVQPAITHVHVDW